MTTKKRAVILGLGKQAEEHIAASINHPQLEIIAGIDTNKNRYQEIMANPEYSELNMLYFDSLQSFVEQDIDYDALILALPHHAYEGLWSDILACKKPILKEKPLGRNYQEARDFMSQASVSGNGLMTAIQRRTHPSYVALAQYISEQDLQIDEVHAHLHLGKGKVGASSELANLGWRGEREKSGGGALLDAGYHMVDLLIYLLGDFDVVSSTMWIEDKVDNGIENEDRSWLLGRSHRTWVFLDTWVKGEINDKGGYQKSEGVKLMCNDGVIYANREGVWVDDVQIFSSHREWHQAMVQQLSDFVQRIDTDNWDDDVIWDQLPAMLKIQQSYALSNQY